jgi:RimJ/RimL family protein N-acetyltransferase
MIDVHNYSVDHKLKDGTAVTIRAISPDDKNRMVKAFKNLEPESIYTRFFGFKSELSDEELKTATEVDFEKTVALVVTILAVGGEETIIGAGRYIMYDPPNDLRSAEIAFTVEEDYQGQGIASSILRHLMHIAREKGVSRFEADVLAENIAMLAVFARSGLPMKKSLEDGAVHVTLSLTVDAPSTMSLATSRGDLPR